MAFSTSVPRRTPPSISTGIRPATCAATSGSAVEPGRRGVELAAAVVRHDDPVGTGLHRQLGVLGREDALHHDGKPGDLSADPREVVPVQVRVEDQIASTAVPIGITNPLRVSRCRRPFTGKSTVQQIAS